MNIVDIIRVDKPRVINLIIPMACVIFFSFFFFWFFGKDGNSSLVDIITNTEPNKAMLMALWISITISALLYFFQKYRIKEMTTDIISGGNEIISMLIILVIAWPLAKVSQDLGLSIFVQDQLSGSLVAWSAPVLLFFISSIITYFIGESW